MLRLSKAIFLIGTAFFLSFFLIPKDAFALSLQLPTELNLIITPDGEILNSELSSNENLSEEQICLSATANLDNGFECSIISDNNLSKDDCYVISPGERFSGNLSLKKIDNTLDLSKRNTIGFIGWEIKPILKKAFAIYSEDDNSLNFYKRSEIPAVGDQFEGRTATSVYTNIETDVYTKGSSPWVNLKPLDSIKVVDKISPISTACWFENIESKSIDLKNLDTSKVTNMMFMFCESKLPDIDFSSFDTSNVEFMSGAFESSSFKNIDLSMCDFSKCIYFSGTFANSYNLKKVNLSGVDASKTEIMNSMFENCYFLEEVNMTLMKVESVTNTDKMFYSCRSIKDLDFSGWKTTNLKDCYQMFSVCSSITSLDLTSFDTSSTKDNILDGIDNLMTLKVGDKFNAQNGNSEFSSHSYMYFYYAFVGSDGSRYKFGDKVPSGKADTYVVQDLREDISNEKIKITSAKAGKEVVVDLGSISDFCLHFNWYVDKELVSKERSFTPTVDQIGKMLSLEIKGINNAFWLPGEDFYGYRGTTTSNEVAIEENKALAGNIKIIGSPIVGETLKAQAFGVQEEADLSYVWIAFDANTDAYSVGVGQSYSPVSADVGKNIAVIAFDKSNACEGHLMSEFISVKDKQ